MKTLILGDGEPTFYIKIFVLGFSPAPEERFAALAFAPAFDMIQFSGKKAMRNPVERTMIDMGWVPMEDTGEEFPDPNPDWSMSLRPDDRVLMNYQGEVFHASGVSVMPEWTAAAHALRTVLCVYIPEPSKEIRGDRVVQALGEKKGLVLTVPFVGV